MEQDFIVRYITTSSVVIQGVKEGEPVELTHVDNRQLSSYYSGNACMGVWWEDGIPSILAQNEEGRSTLGNMGYMMKERVFAHEIEKSRKTKYFNWELLWNPRGRAICNVFSRSRKIFSGNTTRLLRDGAVKALLIAVR